jgi:hypothetical protein
MERVPKHLKPKELRASIAQKSPEVIESKAVECHKEDRGVLVNVFAAGCGWANTQENTHNIHGLSITLLVPFERQGKLLRMRELDK